jgi:hypothetical protein
MGLDMAKNVFQMHTVDMGTGEVISVQIKREIGRASCRERV